MATESGSRQQSKDLEAAQAADAAPYEAPRVVVLGSVAELTAGPPGMSTDGVLGDMMGLSM